MATINSLTSATSTAKSTATQATKDATGFAKDFDSFLVLLTSQLKNQDPLSPMDATQFTTQLVQFTGVEQQIKQNKNLESLIGMQQDLQLASASNYIGRTVDAGGKSVLLNGGAASISYQLNAPGKEVSITIKNAAGETVRTMPGVATAGLQTVTWDGRSDGGTRLVDGKYEFAINAKDLRGQAMSVKTGYSGVVDGFDLSSNGIILRAGAVRIPVSDVTGVRAK